MIVKRAGRENPGGSVEHQHRAVDQGQPHPRRERVGRQERHRRQQRHQRTAQRLGTEHDAALIPAVDEDTRDRAHDQHGRASRDQDTAHRCRGPGLLPSQDRGHPQHQRRAEDHVTQGGDGLPAPEPGEIRADEYQTWCHAGLPDNMTSPIRAVTNVVW